MSKKPKYEEFRKACNAKCGIVSGIAAYFGVERATVYNWCNGSAKFTEALEESRELFLDIAETRLQSLVNGVPEYDESGKFTGWKTPPSEAAVFFTLKTRGRKRGYSERHELDVDANIKGSVSITEWIKDRVKK